MDFNNIISFASVVFLYVLPAMMGLIAFIWFRDWFVNLYTKWKRSTVKKLAERREDRMNTVLEMFKVFMFAIMIVPIVQVITYFLDDTQPDPGAYFFQNTMFLVFMAITFWYIAYFVVQSIYLRSRKDMEEDDMERSAKPI